MNGQLELTNNPNVAILTFTQDDIDNNRLIYRHDGTNTSVGDFFFTVTDGLNPTSQQTFTINVTPGYSVW